MVWTMFHLGAAMASASDRLIDALAGVHPIWLLAALCLHVAGQAGRGMAWHRALDASWPGISRARVCAWYVAGAGLSGLLSGRGGDAVRLALAKREIGAASWPALIATAVIETAGQALAGLLFALAAVVLGVHALPGTPAPVVLGLAVAVLALVAVTVRSSRLQRVVEEFVRGCAVLREPRRSAAGILAWELLAKAMRLGAVTCFLLAFGLPTSLTVVVTVTLLYGSGSMLPLPGVGPAASAGALLVALPVAAGHSLDSGAISALVIAQPVLLTVTGATLSLALLVGLLDVRTPAALVRAGRTLG
jgi:hypothetical protein